MEEARREVVMGISASCLPANAAAKLRRILPRHVAALQTAKCWKEEEGSIGCGRLFEEWEGMDILVLDFLAVLETKQALLGDVRRQNVVQTRLRDKANTEEITVLRLARFL